MSKRVVFRFEGDFKPNIGGELEILEWRVIRDGLPLEALKLVDKDSQRIFTSRTIDVELLNPVDKSVVKGRVVGVKEKFNVKTQTPIILFEVELEE
ncbi:MAG: hypothetical protein OdinLCB4_001820 [Candidatus Odinarchaeum yellowstonii]|uniref:Uncharacterized protein n=1 Tax=Odinarchaeota yellowstonii (strain LCB_4) TaxID=1841599 RepID=A0AAF0IBS1_ODILC|nr:MAG: hypothetical protein OdinLCB4_001820 [Candidatus Odinarchaeum yellowstonii]